MSSVGSLTTLTYFLRSGLCHRPSLSGSSGLCRVLCQFLQCCDGLRLVFPVSFEMKCSRVRAPVLCSEGVDIDIPAQRCRCYLDPFSRICVLLGGAWLSFKYYCDSSWIKAVAVSKLAWNILCTFYPAVVLDAGGRIFGLPVV